MQFRHQTFVGCTHDNTFITIAIVEVVAFGTSGSSCSNSGSSTNSGNRNDDAPHNGTKCEIRNAYDCYCALINFVEWLDGLSGWLVSLYMRSVCVCVYFNNALAYCTPRNFRERSRFLIGKKVTLRCFLDWSQSLVNFSAFLLWFICFATHKHNFGCLQRKTTTITTTMTIAIATSIAMKFI
uniref:Uncharacterized protein n=1 Tax=Glossina palpalis gambiensis TaxID=67801 RepID=A0A1B0BWP0_9MUSC